MGVQTLPMYRVHLQRPNFLDQFQEHRSNFPAPPDMLARIVGMFAETIDSVALAVADNQQAVVVKDYLGR
jgi:hypothetical protein